MQFQLPSFLTEKCNPFVDQNFVVVTPAVMLQMRFLCRLADFCFIYFSLLPHCTVLQLVYRIC